MELQFEKTPWDCLTRVTSQVRGDEQTQEVRLPEHMPDIRRILGTWGQVLLRGKEWRGSGMTVSGGVMAWVLYEAGDGTGNQTVETWIPFQLKWEFPQTRHDGTILAQCGLAMIDARSLSPRKLMVKAVVSALGEALEPDTVEVYTPGTVPEDVYLLRRNYPVRIPREAGEKQFELEQELILPGTAGRVGKLIHNSLQPQVTDARVLAGKVVFRGKAGFHLLFEDLEGQLRTWDQEVEFSQFGDLEQNHGEEALAQVIPAVTALELELREPDRLVLKAGMVGQYVVSDQTVLELVEDAYSNRRPVTARVEDLLLPTVLDTRTQSLRLEGKQVADGDRVLDTALLVSQPRLNREEDGVDLEQSGAFQVLYLDREGLIQSVTLNAEESLHISADAGAFVTASALAGDSGQASFSGGDLCARGEVLIHTQATGDRGIPMVTGLTLGELAQPDPGRPSMILKRAGTGRLWDIAKASGSTVEAITRANDLQGEPEEDRLLLIPVS